MKTRKILSLALVLMMVVAVLGGALAEDTIKLGSLVGVTAKDPSIGLAMVRGFETAVEEINAAGGIQGRLIDYENYDIRDGDTKEAINGYTYLSEEAGCAAIMGPAISNIGLALIDYAADYKVPLVGLWINVACTHDDNDVPYPYMYLAQPTNNNMAEIMAAYMIDQGLTKVALLYNSQQAYHTSQVTSFQAYCEAHGIEIVSDQPYTGDTMDFSSMLTVINESGAECIYAPMDSVTGAAILSTLDALGIMDEGMKIYGDVNYSSPWTSILPDPEVANNIWFPLNVDTSDEKLQTLAEIYLSKWDDCQTQEQINVKYYLGYDIAQTIFQAVDICINEGLEVNGENVNKCLEKTSYTGVTGTIAFSETSHQSTHDECTLYIYNIIKGEYNCIGAFTYGKDS